MRQVIAVVFVCLSRPRLELYPFFPKMYFDNFHSEMYIGKKKNKNNNYDGSIIALKADGRVCSRFIATIILSVV